MICFSRSQSARSPGWTRKGMDVYTDVEVPFTTAVFGGETLVHTLYGDVVCKIKAEPTPAQRSVSAAKVSFP